MAGVQSGVMYMKVTRMRMLIDDTDCRNSYDKTYVYCCLQCCKKIPQLQYLNTWSVRITISQWKICTVINYYARFRGFIRSSKTQC